MLPNMLNAKKVKLHGMQSNRWNTRDKITQYKGLVTLYARDKKIIDIDTTTTRKKLKKEIRNLRKEIDDQHFTLDNAICGDKQRMRNTLADNRRLQLAYQDMDPTKVIEVLRQQNFIKKKELDRIKYEMKKKTEELIALKIEHADLEDRIKYESKEKNREEEQAQVLTAKVRDASLKWEAALEVKNTYVQILNILKKDAIYFDAVLSTLYVDGFNQGKCIFKVTEMGQLATEYLDDKKDEYKMLEKMLKTSIRERQRTLKEVQYKIDSLKNNVKYLIRRDSVVALDEEKRGRVSVSELALMSSIDDIKKKLSKLKETAFVTNIEEILPRIKEQKRQRERLQKLVEKNTADRNRMRIKANHAEELYIILSHTMVETTQWYKEEKARLIEEIDTLKETNDVTIDLIRQRGEHFVQVRAALQQLAEIVRNCGPKREFLRKETSKSAPSKGTKSDVRSLRSEPRQIKSSTISTRIIGKAGNAYKTMYGEHTPLTRPEGAEIDAQKLIADILNRLLLLVNAANAHEQASQAPSAAAPPPMPPASSVEVTGAFQKFVTDMTVSTVVADTGKKSESLLIDEVAMIEDARVPSRAEIKARSAEIVEKCAPTEYDVIPLRK